MADMPQYPGRDRKFREVIPSGPIGSEAGRDLMEPEPQEEHTVAQYPSEQHDQKLHGAKASLESAGNGPVNFQAYSNFGPRCAPMPRTASDDLYLRGYGKNVADPRMEDENFTMDRAEEKPDIVDLYGRNRDGVAHNQGHPGFAAVQSKIAAKEGISKNRAGAILAASSRHASAAAKKHNPRLKKVRG